MKKLFSIVLVFAAAVFAAAPASAYSSEMAELATLLNQEMQGNGASVTYDGDNIIMAFPSSFFSPDEMEMLSGIDDMQMLAPMLKATMAESMGAETMAMFGTIFQQFDTNLVIRINLNGVKKDIVLTGSQLLDPSF